MSVPAWRFYRSHACFGLCIGDMIMTTKYRGERTGDKQQQPLALPAVSPQNNHIRSRRLQPHQLYIIILLYYYPSNQFIFHYITTFLISRQAADASMHPLSSSPIISS